MQQKTSQMKLTTAAPHNSPVLEPERFEAARSAFEIVVKQVHDAASEFSHLSPRTIEAKLAKAVISGARHSYKTAADISRGGAPGLEVCYLNSRSNPRSAHALSRSSGAPIATPVRRWLAFKAPTHPACCSRANSQTGGVWQTERKNDT